MKKIVCTFAVVATILAGGAGCSGGTDDPKPATSPSASATAEGDDLEGEWVGVWKSRGNQGEAVLTVTESQPLTGSIDVVDICAADWNEVRREDDVIRVEATVTSGDCNDNQWDVVVDGTRLTTTDPENETNSLELTRE